MHIGVVGSGDVGRALTVGFLGRGDEVVIGTRDPGKLEQWKSERAPAVRVGSFADAAEFGDIVALATMWAGTESALDLAGRDHLRGKTVLDVTNPLAMSEHGPSLALAHTDSGGEQVQRWLPDSHVVKAFNTVGYELMVKPAFKDGPPTMFYCGDDPGAKAHVRRVIEDFGWEPLDAGGIDGARLLEPLCILWVRHLIQSGSRRYAFKLLHD